MKKIMIVLVLFYSHLYAQGYSNEPIDTYGTGDRFKCFRTNEAGVRKEVSCEDDLNLSSEKKRQINDIKKYQAELETLNTQLITKPYTSLDNLDKTNKGMPDKLMNIMEGFANNIGLELDEHKQKDAIGVLAYIYTTPQKTFVQINEDLKNYKEYLPDYYNYEAFYLEEEEIFSGENFNRYKILFTELEFDFLLNNKDILFIQPTNISIGIASFGKKRSA